MFGGLGNQMFQYCLYRAMECQGIPVNIDDSYYSKVTSNSPFAYHLDIFGITFNKIEDNSLPAYISNNANVIHKLIKWIGIPSRIYFEKKNGVYDPNVFATHRYKYIEGYWQSEKYFINIQNVIRQEFKYNGEWSKGNLAYKHDINNAESVSIHIRRGDYLKFSREYGGCCDLSYYLSAIQYMKDHLTNPIFYFFTNDINWCRQQFSHIKCSVFINGNNGINSYMDMILMSHCKHHIIANSTFSWWGAWLGKKSDSITIAPKIWMNTSSTDDIWCKDWIKL